MQRNRISRKRKFFSRILLQRLLRMVLIPFSLYVYVTKIPCKLSWYFVLAVEVSFADFK